MRSSRGSAAQIFQEISEVAVGFEIHEPKVAEIISPISALPVIRGFDNETGAWFVAADPEDHTDKEPKSFDFDVATVTNVPESSATREYVEDVAPSIAEHCDGNVVTADATGKEQRYH